MKMQIASDPILASSRYWPWAICLLLLLATMLNYMDRVLLNQAASQIKSDLEVASFSWSSTPSPTRDHSDFNYGFLEGAFGISFALGALVFGWAADRYSVVWLYPLCVLGWSIAGVGSGYSENYPQLLASRCLLGFFEAANWPCGLVTTRCLLSRERRSLGNGILHGGGAIGAMLTPLLLLAFSLPGGITELLKTNSLADLLANTKLVPEWRFAFKFIGMLGAIWAFIWILLALPKKHYWPSANTSKSVSSESTWHFIRRFIKGRQFWILLATVCSINATWQFLRVWLPPYMQEAQGYTLAKLSFFSMGYYLMADLGAMLAGALTFYLSKKMGIETARLVVFGLGAVVCLQAWGCTQLEDGWILRILLWLLGMASMGLFPIYFAQSQDISTAHTGRVTGLMGFCCWIFLFFIQAGAGQWIGQRKEVLVSEFEKKQMSLVIAKQEAARRAYSEAITLAGIPPIFALACLLFWPKKSNGHLTGAGTEMGSL